MKTHCPCCGDTRLHTFYSAQQVPVHQNLLYDSLERARQAARGDIALAVCGGCGFIFNQLFDPQLLDYSAQYDNTQSHSPAFSQYVEDLAQSLMRDFALRGRSIVEIGCGKGAFIRRLCELGAAGGTGFDPAYEGPDTLFDGRLRYVRRFFAPQRLEQAGDFYCSRHVIEHVPEPAAFLRDVRLAMGERADTAVFLETPDVLWILRHVSFWDIFYEHCSLFSPGSLARLMAGCGFGLERSVRVFGDQYMWVVGRPAAPGQPGAGTAPVDTAEDVVKAAQGFAARAAERIDEMRQTLAALEQAGRRMVVWGAGAKGVTFLNALGLQTSAIATVIDVNPRKQGMFIPGTGQQIAAPEALPALAPDVVIVMNPNYQHEIARQLSALGLAPQMLVI